MENAARLDAGEGRRTDGAALEQPTGRMEGGGPVPGSEEARDEEMPAMEPVLQQMVQPLPELPGGSGVVMLGTTLGKASASGQVAVASGPPIERVSQAIVLRGIPEHFICAEHEEEGVWQEQLDLSGAINADLQHATQLHWQEQHNITRVSTLPALVRFLLRS